MSSPLPRWGRAATYDALAQVEFARRQQVAVPGAVATLARFGETDNLSQLWCVLCCCELLRIFNGLTRSGKLCQWELLQDPELSLFGMLLPAMLATNPDARPTAVFIEVLAVCVS